MTDPARAQLAVLAAAEGSVTLGPAGYAGVMTDACRAYQALVADRAAVDRLAPELIRLTRDGSPAAIIYAALLLRGAGHDVGPLLAPYADDRRPMSVFPGGCTAVGFWMCEAVRWAVTGQWWSHPERLLEHEVEGIESPNWFELPSAKLLRTAPTGRLDGRDARGRWTFAFVRLWVAPDLALMRRRLDELLGHPNASTRIYAALLIRRLDRTAGDRALTELAASKLEVERLHPWLFDSLRTRRVPIAHVIRELSAWPGWSAL